MSDINDQMTRRDQEHRLNPQAGDYWHEMWSPVMVVVAVEEERVAICDKLDRDKDGWLWKFDAARWISRREFEKLPLYSKGQAGHHMGDKCWCDVSQRRHTYLLEHFGDILPEQATLNPVCYLWSA